MKIVLAKEFAVSVQANVWTEINVTQVKLWAGNALDGNPPQCGGVKLNDKLAELASGDGRNVPSIALMVSNLIRKRKRFTCTVQERSVRITINYQNDNLFNYVLDLFGAAKIRVELISGEDDNPQLPSRKITTGDMSVVAGKSQYQDLVCQLGDWVEALEGSGVRFKASVVIIVPDEWDGNRWLLHVEHNTDVVIVAGNGSRVKCHKLHLSLHSPVFREMLQSNMNETQTQTLVLDDMSEEGIKAFLCYLYYRDMSRGERSPEMALQLLIAAHIYQVPVLEASMRDLFTSKIYSETWWADNCFAAVKLFIFARNLTGPAGIQLKLEAAYVLKCMRQQRTSSDSPVYKELFEKDPEAAMDLADCFATF